MSIETAPTAPKTIRLERLDGTTPHATFVEIFKLFNAAFGSDSSIWTHMYPPPRPPLEHMADVGAYQHMMDVLNPKLVYVAAYAELPDGTERLAGMAVWGTPGYRYKPLVEDKMSEEEKHAYQGYTLPFRNTFRSTLQSHRDTLMGNETYWYLSVLAVHPDFQKFKVGSKLIDQGIAWADAESPPLPVLLESSPAGRRLYESRGFVKEDEFPLDTEGKYAGLEEVRFPLYRRPVKADLSSGPHTTWRCISFCPHEERAFTAISDPAKKGTSDAHSGPADAVKRIRLSLPARPLFDSSTAVDTLTSSFPHILRNEPLSKGNTVHSLYALGVRLLTAAKQHEDKREISIANGLCQAARQAINEYALVVQREVRAEARIGQSSVGLDFLRVLLERWKSWEMATNRLASVILTADRICVTTARAQSSEALTRFAATVFKESILEEQSIQERSTSAFGQWLREQLAQADSENREPVSELLQIQQNVIRTFTTFVLRLAAEQPYTALYISETADFIISSAKERHARAMPSDAPKGAATEFVRWCVDKMQEVQGRSEFLFQPSAVNPDGSLVPNKAKEVWKHVKQLLDTNVVETLVVEVTGRALTEAMHASDAGALKRLYTLLSSVKKFTEFRKALAEHVKAHATELISKPENDAAMVSSLLTFKRFCDSSIATLYDLTDPAYPAAFKTAAGENKEARRRLALEGEVRDGLKAGMETRQAVPAELIAKYLHRLMEKGQGNKSETEWNREMDEIVDLVKFTKDKDIFKEFYINQLAKRLLSGKSASNEDEIKMVKKLQNEFGEEFTTGDAMMKDLAQSEDMNKKWNEARMTNGKDASNLSVNVLSQGQWPPYKQLGAGWENLSVPRNMQQQLDDFAAWYGHTFSGRVLSWRHQHSTVTLTARFPAGNKEIDVSLFQAMVLLQFNDTKSLTFEEISVRTGIERQELIRTLQSLYALKATRMLVKRPPGKDVAPSDKFIWNASFTREDRVRFKINQLQQDMTAEESRQTNEKVFEDRNLTLDAQIVRIMKGKKALKLPDLINQVVDAVKNMFQPEVKAIKVQVESLIEREYLERDEDDKNLLKYLA